MEAVYITILFYVLHLKRPNHHSLIVEKIQENLLYYVDWFFAIREITMCLACLICAKLYVNSAPRAHYTQMRHHCKDHLWAWNIIYGLKNTLYGLKRLFTAWKRLFTTLTYSAEKWVYFWSHDALLSFNQSMNKNIWMVYTILVSYSFLSMCLQLYTAPISNLGLQSFCLLWFIFQD